MITATILLSEAEKFVDTVKDYGLAVLLNNNNEKKIPCQRQVFCYRRRKKLLQGKGLKFSGIFIQL